MHIFLKLIGNLSTIVMMGLIVVFFIPLALIAGAGVLLDWIEERARL